MTRRFASGLDVDTVLDWCDLARRAPSAGFSQGTHFLVRGDTVDTLESLGAAAWFTERQPGVLAAPVAVLVLADRRAYTDRYAESDKSGHGLESDGGWRVPYWSTDAAMAAQNLLLIAESHRRGALFIGVFRDPRPALRTWGVPDEVDCIGVVLVGDRADDDRPTGSPTTRVRRDRTEVVHHERW